MKLLFMDDNQNRHKTFRQNTIGFAILQAYTGREALDFMREHDDIDVIFLDHDLNYETVNQLNDEEEDGRWVCKQMIAEDLYKEAQVIIHSMNPLGAEEMEKLLTDAGYGNVHQICSAWTMLSKNAKGGLSIDQGKGMSQDYRDYQ